METRNYRDGQGLARTGTDKGFSILDFGLGRVALGGRVGPVRWTVRKDFGSGI